MGYLHKGNYYYSSSDYSNSLENFLLAKDFSKDNPDTYHITNFNLGLLKLELGNYQEAHCFYNMKNFSPALIKAIYWTILKAINAIGYTYSKMDNLGLSDPYIQSALERCRKNNKSREICNILLLVSGINQYKRKAYQSAIKTLGEVSKSSRENSYSTENLALVEYYIGMSLFRNNNIKYIDRFKTVDSIAYTAKSVSYELRGTYPLLIEHNKKAGDQEKQLFYFEHLLEFDSILNKSNHSLSADIHTKYDTPN